MEDGVIDEERWGWLEQGADECTGEQ